MTLRSHQFWHKKWRRDLIQSVWKKLTFTVEFYAQHHLLRKLREFVRLMGVWAVEVYGKVSAINLAVTMMLKFIISLPKSSALCPSKSKTTTDSESHAICQRDSCTCTRANDTTPTAKSRGKRKNTQFYIDLGQKAFNSTSRCKRCQMVYIADDRDDKESHKKFCAQVFILTSCMDAYS